MNKIFLIVVLAFFSLFVTSSVSAQSTSQNSYKFNMITVKFVDALTLEPVVNSQIKTQFDKNDDGNLSQEESYTTDSNGEIRVPTKGKVHSFRSNKGDNINYVKQGDSIIINALENPRHTIYLNPIFSIDLKLKTDFNFLTSFFRRFRFGSYLEAPASELNTGSVIEPNCFMSILQKGETMNQHSDTLQIKAYFARDLNSSTKEPYKCSIYAWEGIRKVAGIKQIDFSSLNRSQTNKIEIPLDMTYDNLVNSYHRIKESGN